MSRSSNVGCADVDAAADMIVGDKPDACSQRWLSSNQSLTQFDRGMQPQPLFLTKAIRSTSVHGWAVQAQRPSCARSSRSSAPTAGWGNARSAQLLVLRARCVKDCSSRQT